MSFSLFLWLGFCCYLSIHLSVSPAESDRCLSFAVCLSVCRFLSRFKSFQHLAYEIFHFSKGFLPKACEICDFFWDFQRFLKRDLPLDFYVSVFPSPAVCLPVCLSVCQSFFSIYLSVCLSVLSVFLFICPYLSTCLSVLSVCLSIFLSVCLSVCL